MNIITIIVARGGSKRLHRKNTKLFCGRPLIAWSIIQSRACEGIAETFVSTDDEEIADISREYGAIVLRRQDVRESLDVTSGGVPISLAVHRLAKEREFDAVIQFFTSTVLRKTDDLDRLIKKWNKVHHKIDVSHHRPFEPSGGINFYWPLRDSFLAKRIDDDRVEEVIVDKTGLYLNSLGGMGINSKEQFLKYVIDWDKVETWYDPIIFNRNPTPKYYCLAEWWQGFEIDTQEDFDLCEYLFNLYLKKDWEEAWKLLQ